MCTTAELAAKARGRLRDFGTYFEVPFSAAPVTTLRLPHPLVDASKFVLWTPSGTVISPSAYMLDQRNGIVSIKVPSDYPDGLGASGYYYEWFLNEDLEFAAEFVAQQHTYDRPQLALDGSDFTGLECNIIAIGAVSQAMWSLLAELSLDVDVSTPEGMSIPVHQRFQQAWQIAQYWDGQYKQQAAMLGVGLDRMEQFDLRRESLTTNRLVPQFRPREIDDPRRPERIVAEIPTGVQEGHGQTVQVPEPPAVGWNTFGTSG
jgi:hypothetical protein